MHFICLTIRAAASCSLELIFGDYTPTGILQHSGYGTWCWVYKEDKTEAMMKSKEKLESSHGRFD